MIETEIRQAQLELRTLVTDNLRQAAEDNVKGKCSQLLVEDIKAQTIRQKYLLEQMNTITNILLSLTSIQEALGSMISQELLSLESLEKTLKDCLQIQHRQHSKDEANSEAHKNLQTKQELMQRKTLVPWDNGVRSLHKLLTGKELDPSMVTHEDLQHLLQRLQAQKQRLNTEMTTQLKSWKSTREEVRTVLKSILMEINVHETSKHFDLSCYDATSAIKNAQKEVGQLEHNVKDALNEWERALKLLKENPVLCLEKKVWKDFMNNGAKMESSINVMRQMGKK